MIYVYDDVTITYIDSPALLHKIHAEQNSHLKIYVFISKNRISCSKLVQQSSNKPVDQSSFAFHIFCINDADMYAIHQLVVKWPQLIKILKTAVLTGLSCVTLIICFYSLLTYIFYVFRMFIIIFR